MTRATVMHIGPGALGSLQNVWNPAWSQAAIIGDRNVIRLLGSQVRARVAALVPKVAVLDFPPGERHKTRETKAMLEDRLLAAHFPRDGVIIGLGGGLSLDVAGFVAATYMRGVDTVYIPTTLLAQVDAAIGGKTGVNAPQGKNLIGAFHMPRAILSDTDLPAALPAKEWQNGLAELVKTALVADRTFFAWLENNAGRIALPARIDPYPVRRSAAIKSGIVARDERETGRRAVLNFGHTVGHAIERATDYSVSHGAAVAAGMIVESRLAMQTCGFPRAAFERLASLLCRLGLGDAPRVPAARMVSIMSLDKKGRRGEIRMSLPDRIGAMARTGKEWTCPVHAEIIRSVLSASLPARPD